MKIRLHTKSTILGQLCIIPLKWLWFKKSLHFTQSTCIFYGPFLPIPSFGEKFRRKLFSKFIQGPYSEITVGSILSSKFSKHIAKRCWEIALRVFVHKFTAIKFKEIIKFKNFKPTKQTIRPTRSRCTCDIIYASFLLWMNYFQALFGSRTIRKNTIL